MLSLHRQMIPDYMRQPSQPSGCLCQHWMHINQNQGRLLINLVTNLFQGLLSENEPLLLGVKAGDIISNLEDCIGRGWSNPPGARFKGQIIVAAGGGDKSHGRHWTRVSTKAQKLIILRWSMDQLPDIVPGFSLLMMAKKPLHNSNKRPMPLLAVHPWYLPRALPGNSGCIRWQCR